MATGFVTTSLADFTSADPTKVLAAYILEGKGTKDYFTFEEEVKYQKKIPYISAYSVDISTGAIAGYNTGSGTTTPKDVTLTSKQFKIFETYTKESLNKTILASLGRGTDPNDLPLKDVIYTLKGKALHLANEKLIWQADSSTTQGSTAGAANSSFEGILSQIRTGGAGGFGNPAVALNTLTDASVLQHIGILVNKQITAKPEFTMNPMVMAMSPANFSVYARALYNLNGTVTTQTVGADGKPVEELFVPGTSIKAVSTIGLDGKNDIVLTIPENIIVCYDLVNEDEKLEFIYNPFARWFELAGQYKLGVQVVDVSSCIVSRVTL